MTRSLAAEAAPRQRARTAAESVATAKERSTSAKATASGAPPFHLTAVVERFSTERLARRWLASSPPLCGMSDGHASTRRQAHTRALPAGLACDYGQAI